MWTAAILPASSEQILTLPSHEGNNSILYIILFNVCRIPCVYTGKKCYRSFILMLCFFFKNEIKFGNLKMEIDNVILAIFNSLLTICGVNQMPISKSIFANLVCVLSLLLWCITTHVSSSRSHQNYDWHRPKASTPKLRITTVMQNHLKTCNVLMLSLRAALMLI